MPPESRRDEFSGVDARMPGVRLAEHVAAARGRFGSPRRWLVAGYWVLWVLLAAGSFRYPALHVVFWGALGLTGTAAVVHGMVLNRPASRLPWILVAAALFTFVLGDISYDVLTELLHRDNPFPSVADVFYLATYPLSAGALLGFIRRRSIQRDRGGLLDALTITVGLALLSWTYLMIPYVHDGSLTVLERLVSVAYPLGDVLMLSMLVRSLTAGGSRTRSVQLLTLGTAGLLAADVLYGVIQLNGSWAVGGPVDLGWIACYTLWGTAALHPTMRSLTQPQPPRRGQLRRGRLLLLAVASLIAPGVLFERALSGNVGETATVAVFSAVLFVLVFLRFAGLVTAQGQSVDRESALRQAAGMLSAATTIAAIRDATETAMPLLAPNGMTLPARLVLHQEAGDAERSILAELYGPTPRGPVRLPATALGEARSWTAGLPEVLVVPVAEDGAGTLLGVLAAAGELRTLLAVEDALETLASQVGLATVRATLDAELVARRSEAHFRAFIQNAADVIVVLDDAHRITYATPSVQRLVGVSPEDITGSELAVILQPDVRLLALGAITRMRHRRGQSEVMADWRLVTADRRTVEVEVVLSDLRDEPEVSGIVLTMRDVTERRELERELKHRAFHDGLTGLANRALFTDRVEHALARARRGNHDVAVLVCDLDDFKEVNDTLGHLTGDQLLIEVGERLRDCLRAGDTAARLGGDEFAVLVEEVSDAAEVELLADRVCSSLAETFHLDQGAVCVSVSIGVATSHDGADVTTVLRHADLALYAAKEAGKRSWRLFEQSLQTSMRERLALRSDLEQSLTDEHFALVYQPIVSLATGAAVGVEALLRWTHPERGQVSPADFVTIAEETGLIVPLGSWVLRQALAAASRWELGHPPHLHVNVSVRQLQEPGFVDTVRTALAEAGLPPSSLILELTESLFLSDNQQVNGAIAELKALGVRLAIDDFGTGYSSLSYLRTVPVDVLKIDKSFVWALGQPGQEALIDAIVRIASTLDLELVAEGVETTEHRDVLARLGCSHAQGYLFSPPVPADNVPALLAPARHATHRASAMEGWQARQSGAPASTTHPEYEEIR